ncbi:MAG: phosphatase PAP2 family protein, partial [Duncaniella sp.]|nr:phosphatase PAP2 family protein [Duncaniella sp.]
MTLIETIDTQLLLFVNGMHCDIMDAVMLAITNRWFWVPFYLLLVAYIVRKKGPTNAFWCILSIAIAVALADQIGAGSLREGVA